MQNSESLTNLNNRISKLEKEKLNLQTKKDPLSAKKINAKIEKINKELEKLNKEKKELNRLEKIFEKTENSNVSYKNKEDDNLKKFYKILDEEPWKQTKEESNNKKSWAWIIYSILWFLFFWCAIICHIIATHSDGGHTLWSLLLCALFWIIGWGLVALWKWDEENKKQ